MAEKQAFTKHVPAIVQFEKKPTKLLGLREFFKMIFLSLFSEWDVSFSAK